jgi:hypothetical protein
VSTALFGVVSSFCSFILFCFYLAFFIVTVTAVRTRRPDAFGPLAAGAATLLADFMLRVILGMLLPLAMRSASSGMSSYYAMQSMVSVVGTIIAMAGWTLLIIGVIRIASPPREQNFNRAPGDY